MHKITFSGHALYTFDRRDAEMLTNYITLHGWTGTLVTQVNDHFHPWNCTDVEVLTMADFRATHDSITVWTENFTTIQHLTDALKIFTDYRLKKLEDIRRKSTVTSAHRKERSCTSKVSLTEQDQRKLDSRYGIDSVLTPDTADIKCLISGEHDIHVGRLPCQVFGSVETFWWISWCDMYQPEYSIFTAPLCATETDDGDNICLSILGHTGEHSWMD